MLDFLVLADVVSYFKLPPILKVPTLIGWDFFARSPSENRNDVARVHSTAARFPARFSQIPLFVISRDASARDPTLFIFNDLQAAGSISNLVGRWGMKKDWHGMPEFTLVPADFAKGLGGGIRPSFLSPLASSLRSGAL